MNGRGSTLRVGVWNIERFGYDEGQGHHRLAAAVDWLLEQTPVPPDVLALPEARCGLDEGQRAIRRLVSYPLSRHLPDGGWYEPVMASAPLPGRRNHLHLLLVNTATVRPLAWWDPHGPLPADRDSGFVVCEIAGREVWICCEHWDGGKGREEFNRAANRLATHGGATNRTLLLGDFNADSGWEHEQHHELDWYAHCETADALHTLEQKAWWNPATGRWEIDTRQLDKLRGHLGHLDMGEEAGDPTPPTRPGAGSGLRIDRIFRSTGLTATLLDTRSANHPGSSAITPTSSAATTSRRPHESAPELTTGDPSARKQSSQDRGGPHDTGPRHRNGTGTGLARRRRAVAR